MADAVSIAPLLLAGGHFITWMNSPPQPIILQPPIFQMHRALSVTPAPFVQEQPRLHSLSGQNTRIQSRISLHGSTHKTESRMFQLSESVSSLEQEQVCGQEHFLDTKKVDAILLLLNV